MSGSVVVLGGGGGVGSTAVRALATVGAFDEIVVADVRLDVAEKVAAEYDGATAVAFDATDRDSIRAAVSDASVVLNCVGPFYRFGPPILEAVISAGVDYVDVCDDLAPTLRMLEMDVDAREAGVTAVIGMGNSPGLANLVARMCADHFLDQVESVDIMHIHGGEPEEGAGVIKHRIAAMLDDVPVFVDGEFRTVRQLEPSGAEFVEEVEFRDLGAFPVYPYPHPETVTLPRHIDGLRRCTNRGVVFPLEYFDAFRHLAAAGACGEEPVRVDGETVVPVDFSVALLQALRPGLLARAGVTGPAGCLRVDVKGRKDGEEHAYVFSLSSRSAGAGEGTGIPAALATVMVGRGDVAEKGVLPPEASIDPMTLLGLAGEVVTALGIGGGDTFHVAHVLPDGSAEDVPLNL